MVLLGATFKKAEHNFKNRVQKQIVCLKKRALLLLPPSTTRYLRRYLLFTTVCLAISFCTALLFSQNTSYKIVSKSVCIYFSKYTYFPHQDTLDKSSSYSTPGRNKQSFWRTHTNRKRLRYSLFCSINLACNFLLTVLNLLPVAHWTGEEAKIMWIRTNSLHSFHTIPREDTTIFKLFRFDIFVCNIFITL